MKVNLKHKWWRGISIKIYNDKLYYINCAKKDKSPVVILDIQDTSKREVLQDRDAMKMLIKDDKIIIVQQS